MKKYMLTIEGHPAVFNDTQIVYCGKSIRAEDMEVSLKKVKSKIRQTIQWRQENGFSNDSHYGYIIVYF